MTEWLTALMLPTKALLLQDVLVGGYMVVNVFCL